jgi:hypothetical protein
MILTRDNQRTQKNVCQCHFVHHKFHIDWPGFNPRPLHAAFVVDTVALFRLL